MTTLLLALSDKSVAHLKRRQAELNSFIQLYKPVVDCYMQFLPPRGATTKLRGTRGCAHPEGQSLPNNNGLLSTSVKKDRFRDRICSLCSVDMRSGCSSSVEFERHMSLDA